MFWQKKIVTEGRSVQEPEPYICVCVFNQSKSKLRWCYYDQGVHHLHFISLFPENNSKDETDNSGHKESDNIVLRIPPVRPVLFPEASLELSKEWLGILGGEV